MAKNFASDNNSGVHPNVMNAIIKCNEGHIAAYGSDSYSLEAIELIKKTFDAKGAFFTLNGTGTNICILDALTSKFGAVMCTDLSHVFIHEAGAASKTGQFQLLTVPTEDGKLKPELLDKFLQFRDEFHFPHPEVITIAQTTEMGTVYTIEELKSIVAYAKKQGFKVHMDGSRISNACAKLGIGLKEMTKDVGIDALSFGMCKNGLMFGECCVFFDDAHDDFIHLVKANLQLQSKSRYVGAQYLEIMKNDLWLECGKNANDMAVYMYDKLSEIKEVTLVAEPDSNMVFVQFPPAIIEDLQAFMDFYLENRQKNYSRLVCSFDTTKEDVDAFVAKLKELLA